MELHFLADTPLIARELYTHQEDAYINFLYLVTYVFPPCGPLANQCSPGTVALSSKGWVGGSLCVGQSMTAMSQGIQFPAGIHHLALYWTLTISLRLKNRTYLNFGNIGKHWQNSKHNWKIRLLTTVTTMSNVDSIKRGTFPEKRRTFGNDTSIFLSPSSHLHQYSA